MEGALLATWASRSAEERAACLQICDPEVVQLIDLNMRMLWTAEIQARQFGVKGPIHPFDHSQLPLLSTMQFDGNMEGAMEDAQKVFKQVKWPQEVSEDPMAIISALQSSGLPCASGDGALEKPLPRQQWVQLFQPPAKAWSDFEKQLARLVEQLVMAPPEGVASPPDSGAVAEEGGDADADAEDAGEEKPALRARAAKRQRQRERRKMGKALLRAGNGLDADDADPLVVGASDALTAAASAAASHAPVASSASKKTTAEETSEGHKANGEALPAPQDNVERLAEGRVLEAAAAGKAAERNGSHAKSVAAAAATAQTTAPAAEAARVAPEELAKEPKSSASLNGDVSGSTSSAKSGSMAPPSGVGRGRPMGGQVPNMGLPGRGMGVGRGKALAPPPGLQMLNLNNSQKSPGLTLSRPWMPGPPIPEEFGERLEDDMDVYLDDLDYPSWNGMPPDLELPMGAIGSGHYFGEVERTPSLWSKASCIETPTEDWGMTPSVASEPPSPALVSQYGAAGGVFNVAMNMAGTSFSGMDMVLPPSATAHDQYAQPVIPMYVTVPLAVAHCCPHCGKHFATPPGVEGPGNGLAPQDGPGPEQAADAGGKEGATPG